MEQSSVSPPQPALVRRRSSTKKPRKIISLGNDLEIVAPPEATSSNGPTQEESSTQQQSSQIQKQAESTEFSAEHDAPIVHTHEQVPATNTTPPPPSGVVGASSSSPPEPSNALQTADTHGQEIVEQPTPNDHAKSDDGAHIEDYDRILRFLDGDDDDNLVGPTVELTATNSKEEIRGGSWRHRDIEVYSGKPKGLLLGAEWPPGWTMKSFKRQGGATAGRLDHYWYTPQKKLKLRSIFEIERFLLALDAYGGDEVLARKNMNSFGRPLKRSKGKPSSPNTKNRDRPPAAKHQAISPRQANMPRPSKHVFGSTVSIDFLWHLHNPAFNDPIQFCNFLIASLPTMYNINDLTFISPSHYDVATGRFRNGASLSVVMGLSPTLFHNLVHTYAYCCGGRRALLFLEVCRWYFTDISVSCHHEMGLFSHAFHMERSPLTIAQAFEFEQLLSFFREQEGEHWFGRWNTASPRQIFAFLKEKLSTHLRSKIEEGKRDSDQQPQITNDGGSRQAPNPQEDQNSTPVGPPSAPEPIVATTDSQQHHVTTSSPRRISEHDHHSTPVRLPQCNDEGDIEQQPTASSPRRISEHDHHSTPVRLPQCNDEGDIEQQQQQHAAKHVPPEHHLDATTKQRTEFSSENDTQQEQELEAEIVF